MKALSPMLLLLLVACSFLTGQAGILSHYIDGRNDRTNIITNYPGMVYPIGDQLTISSTLHLGDFVLSAGDLPPVANGSGNNWLQIQDYLMQPDPEPFTSLSYFEITLQSETGKFLELDRLTFDWGAFSKTVATYQSKFIYAVYANVGSNGELVHLGRGEQMGTVPIGTSVGFHQFEESASFDLSILNGFNLSDVTIRCSFANNTPSTVYEEVLLMSNIMVTGNVVVPELSVSVLGLLGMGFLSARRIKTNNVS